MSGFRQSMIFTRKVKQIACLGSGQGCPLRMSGKASTFLSIILTDKSNGKFGRSQFLTKV